MNLFTHYVLYFYLFICIVLMLYNFCYLNRIRRRARRHARRKRRWELDVWAVDEGIVAPQKLFWYMRRTENLMVFNEVMSVKILTRPQEVRTFFLEHPAEIRALAREYGRKPAMERAFFAYVVASFHPPLEEEHDPLVETLLGYLDSSTVYCRENVLSALYTLGSGQGVEHVYSILSEWGWFHSPKLLSDGMMRFAGDKEALVRRLWQHRREWDEDLVTAIVQFAAMLPGDAFAQPFLDALEQERLPLELRFSLVRYFQHHPSPQAEPLLLRLIEAHPGEQGQLAIAAAASLSAYESPAARQTLKTALHSRNWHIRYNAAASLGRLGLAGDELEAIRSTGDRYAMEMLDYALPTVPAGKGGCA